MAVKRVTPNGRALALVGVVRASALLALAILSTAANGLVAQEAAANQAALAAEVEAREVAFAQTMADRDFDAFLTFVSDEAVFFAGEAPLRGSDAVAAEWRRFYEGPDAPFSWEPDLVVVLRSGDLAHSTGAVRNTAGEVVARFNSIWRLDVDGEWRVIFDKGCPLPSR